MGQTTNDAHRSPPDVSTARNAGQAILPVRPAEATAILPVPTEVVSLPSPTSAELAMLPPKVVPQPAVDDTHQLCQPTLRGPPLATTPKLTPGLVTRNATLTP